jgi:hypothetical protein
VGMESVFYGFETLKLNIMNSDRIKEIQETTAYPESVSIGQIALLKIAQLAVSVNSDETTLTTEATFDGKRYKCKMLVTWEEA